jgi:perosamine synthetase
MFDGFIEFVREIYGTNDFIPLHEPRFLGNEKKYLMDTIDSTFVSSVGKYVDDFESAVAEYTGANYAIATVNGTASLHTALVLAGVQNNDEVITQSLTFVATCNAIRYCNAEPVFVDVSKNTLGLSADSMSAFLEESCEIRNDGFCWNKHSNKIIRACVPMHTFGFPVQLDEISNLCQRYNITLVEDAAESLGSTYKEKHITATAKVKHKWAFEHDEVGFNYRLPNLNAALGLTQMESLPKILEEKRIVAEKYQEWGKANGILFFKEPMNTKANYWLNTVITENITQRDAMLEQTNNSGVMTRPAWTLMSKLPMFKDSQKGNLSSSEWLEDRVVNIPSSVRI